MNLSSVVDLAGGAATGILYVLLALSAIQLAILIERAIVFIRTRADRRRLAELSRALDEGRLTDVEARVKGATSLEERVLAAGIARTSDGAEAVDEVVRSQLAETRFAYERRLSFLATLGNNAPFIGLLGTVLGIMHAFANLSAQSGQVSTEVMAGISEALVSTGVGLFVALPAVIAFNWFQRSLKGRVVAAESLSGSLLAHLRGRSVRAERAGLAIAEAA
jgi:biopolymer transport protein ExbB/TolQ